MHFDELKILYFVLDITEVCSWESNLQQISIGSDNG